MFAEADDPPCEPHQRDRADHEERRAPRQPGHQRGDDRRRDRVAEPRERMREALHDATPFAREPVGDRAGRAGSVAPSPMPSSSRAANSSPRLCTAGGEGGDDPDQPAADQRDAGAEPVGDPAAADLADCIRIRERGECDAEFGIRQAEFGLDRAGCGREVDAVDVEDERKRAQQPQRVAPLTVVVRHVSHSILVRGVTMTPRSLAGPASRGGGDTV